MSIFPRPLKKVLDKIVPFSQEDKVPLFNLGSGTYDATTVLRGDGVWATPPGLSGYVPYIGATQDVDLGIYKLTADAVEFSLTPTNAPGAGQIAYDGASGALSYLLNSSNVLSRIGQTMHAYVHNAEAVTITKGQAVYLFSASGNKASVKLAFNTSDATSAKTFGLAAEDIGANQNGMVICQGVIDGLNTGMYTAGDTLYLGSTPGGYTNVKPYAPNHFVYVGIVERANAGNGQIYVRVQNGYELDEIHDVYINPATLADNNLLQYDLATSLWKNESLSTAGIQPTLVSATNIKTINGISLLGSGDITVGSSSGRFGIADSNGVYTYYSTFTLAMTAATAGQTIEMFADVVETGAVEITLKNGVNINGNGHTYTLNNNGLIHAFRVPVTVETSCNILNLNVIRTGSTGTIADNSALILGTNGTGTINCTGSTFRNNGSGCGIVFNTNSLHSINYAVAYATTTWGAIGIFSSAGVRLNNCIGYGTSGGFGIRCHSGGDLSNCTGYSDSGYGLYGGAGNHSNCTGISNSGNGFFSASSSFNWVGRSISGIGFEITTAINAIGCVGISTSGRGISLQNALAYNCTGISSSSNGVSLGGSTKVYNITAKSTSSYALWGTTITTQIYGGYIICNWNNAARGSEKKCRRLAISALPEHIARFFF